MKITVVKSHGVRLKLSAEGKLEFVSEISCSHGDV
jgi:hypothetical protein